MPRPQFPYRHRRGCLTTTWCAPHHRPYAVRSLVRTLFGVTSPFALRSRPAPASHVPPPLHRTSYTGPHARGIGGACPALVGLLAAVSRRVAPALWGHLRRLQPLAHAGTRRPTTPAENATCDLLLSAPGKGGCCNTAETVVLFEPFRCPDLYQQVFEIETRMGAPLLDASGCISSKSLSAHMSVERWCGGACVL